MIDEQTGSCGWFFCGCCGWFFCGCGGCRNVGVWGHGNRPTRPATYNLFICAGWTFLATCVRVYNDEWINGQEWNVVFIQVGFFVLQTLRKCVEILNNVRKSFNAILVPNISACFFCFIFQDFEIITESENEQIYSVPNSTFFLNPYTVIYKMRKFLTTLASFIYKIFIHRTSPAEPVTCTWVSSVTVVKITLASLRLLTSGNWTTIANRDRYIETKSVEMGIHT